MTGIERPTGRRDGERGQLVLAAAAVLAVALAPVVLAYLQLGYHADVAASTEYDAPVANAERLLERAVHEVGTNATGRSWSERDETVRRVRDRLDPHLSTLATARIESGTAYATSYNQSAAEDWATNRCPGGPNRDFGDCVAEDGVVVQERVGKTHVLAVALDVTVTTERGERRVTLVVESG
ncbi:DUF7261 family protein [Halorientalis pallida]|uniref:DUF7261 family protein n=1 Tax=Halorientalis pallida TaxID=2479928 RepID=UPI003C6EC2AE